MVNQPSSWVDVVYCWAIILETLIVEEGVILVCDGAIPTLECLIIQEQFAVILTSLKHLEGPVRQKEISIDSEDPERCNFFFWVDQLMAGNNGYPHRPPNNSSESLISCFKDGIHALSQTQVPRTPSRMEVQSNATGSGELLTPSSSNQAKSYKSPGQLKRDEEIRRAMESSTDGAQSSQPTPTNFRLTSKKIDSDDDNPFATPLTPPPHGMANVSNKGKMKADIAHNLKLTGILEDLTDFQRHVTKLERQVKGLERSNMAKMVKIKELQTDNDTLKGENDELRRKMELLKPKRG
ncbi:hypothetical protein BT96DRAFT_930428 [Gymnopus androsaceus JB14]|uniref:Uncharacterized protein n=1 Tax=Gymnopus androsaceus JB14 TaxID=1447944 RepID=A0A6A4ING0_9AGAR|nr:hypothetical protein BT96DRAFT_930428 [Gymnopus androsaceus JB14]